MYGAGVMVVKKCKLEGTSLMGKTCKSWHWEVCYNMKQP